MNITELSIRRPVTTIMLFVSMVVIGLIASFRLPLEAEPEATMPTLSTVPATWVRVPFGVTTAACPAWEYLPDRDAFVVARLRAAGAVFPVKLATHEFAIGGPAFDMPFPPARNPWNTAHHPGGSSSGAAASPSANGVSPFATASRYSRSICST